MKGFHSKNEKYKANLQKEINRENNLVRKSDALNKYQNLQKENFKKDDQKSVFIEIKKLGQRDVFVSCDKMKIFKKIFRYFIFIKKKGLVEIIYDFEENLNKVCLVSDGTECILLNKKFILNNMTHSLRSLLKQNVNTVF